ncbi:hypothetical protein PILCRDRAFT_826401, partial [Piloderma croceum F 1598]
RSDLLSCEQAVMLVRGARNRPQPKMILCHTCPSTTHSYIQGLLHMVRLWCKKFGGIRSPRICRDASSTDCAIRAIGFKQY